MEHKSNCLICGEDLIYLEDMKEYECHYCGEKKLSHAACKNGHYICDICHSKGAYEIIKAYCTKCDSKNPFRMAIDLMKHPSIKMHGPEHHFLVPAVLITAYYNSIGENKLIIDKIDEAEKRAKNVLGGFCGFYGNCGAAVGTGIFISIITGATPLSKEEWKMSNLMTSQSLKSIAENGGPRCCKRDSFLAIEEAAKFLEENFKIDLETDIIKCEFSNFNSQCLKESCTFYNK